MRTHCLCLIVTGCFLLSCDETESTSQDLSTSKDIVTEMNKSEGLKSDVHSTDTKPAEASASDSIPDTVKGTKKFGETCCVTSGGYVCTAQQIAEIGICEAGLKCYVMNGGTSATVGYCTPACSSTQSCPSTPSGATCESDDHCVWKCDYNCPSPVKGGCGCPADLTCRNPRGSFCIP